VRDKERWGDEKPSLRPRRGGDTKGGSERGPDINLYKG